MEFTREQSKETLCFPRLNSKFLTHSLLSFGTYCHKAAHTFLLNLNRNINFMFTQHLEKINAKLNTDNVNGLVHSCNLEIKTDTC